MTIRSFSLIIFDLDGVLIDSEPVMRVAFDTAYARHVGDGVPPFEDFLMHMGRPLPEIFALMKLPATMETTYVSTSAQHFGKIRIFDEVVEVLEGLRKANIRLAIATGKSGARAREILKKLAILHYFDIVVGGDEIERPKPSGQVIDHICSFVGSPKTKTLFVGDSVADMQAGREAAVPTAAAFWGQTPAHDLVSERPSYTLAQPITLLALCGMPHSQTKN